MEMTTLDPKLEMFFTLRNLHIGRGDETPQFDAILCIKDRAVAEVKNHGRGGANVYHWTAPFTREWAETKLFPLAVKVASAKMPEFANLFSKSGGSALDSLVFDQVEEIRVASRGRRSRTAHSDDEGRHERGPIQGPPGAPTRQPLIQVPSVPPYVPPAVALHKGAKVQFGRQNGEKTLGKVLKINAKSVLVETLEERGSKFPAGVKFRVAPSLLTIVT